MYYCIKYSNFCFYLNPCYFCQKANFIFHGVLRFILLQYSDPILRTVSFIKIKRKEVEQSELIKRGIKNMAVKNNFSTPFHSQTEEAYLNLLRCFAMYFVILLHSFAPFFTQLSLFNTKTWWVMNLLNPITRMGVPIFFMISGYLALSSRQTNQIRLFYKKRIGTILLPFFFWNILYFLLNGLLYHNSINPLLFFTQLFQTGSKYHLWFLYQIIGLYLLAPFLKRIIDHCSSREQFLLLFIFLLQPTIFHFFNTVQATISIAPFKALVEGYTGFFLYGFLLGTTRFSARMKHLIYLGGVLGLLISILGNYWMSSPELLNLRWNEGYSITHYLTSGAFFLFIKELLQKQNFKKWKSGLLLCANRISKLTFGMYLSHVMILETFYVLLSSAGIALSPAMQTVSGFLVASIGSTFLSYLISRTPFKNSIA